MKKIQITTKQAEQFNHMLSTLRRIHKNYMPVEDLRMSEEAEFHGEQEVIEMAYENIQEEARNASRNVKHIKIVAVYVPPSENGETLFDRTKRLNEERQLDR
jgi:exonuclease III